jgi:hypothetical protein
VLGRSESGSFLLCHRIAIRFILVTAGTRMRYVEGIGECFRIRGSDVEYASSIPVTVIDILLFIDVAVTGVDGVILARVEEVIGAPVY